MNDHWTSATRARQRAAAQLIGCYESLARNNENLLQVVVGSGAFECWRKYPSADAVDPRSGFQYFYHAHSADDRPGSAENGHFHTFARFDRGMRNIEDWPVSTPIGSDARASEAWDADSAHLLAISVDARGLPIELFTVNRWVTGDRWCLGTNLARLAKTFDVAQAGPPLVASWLKACFRLYDASIHDLMLERDAKVREAIAAHGSGYRVTEDRALEVLSSRKLSFSDDVERALRGSPAA